MPIPAPDGPLGILPPGIHRATLDELEVAFVDNAPFGDERRLVFQAFRTWFAFVDAMLPNSRYWIDGGFVTHKTSDPPSDIDVMIFCAGSQLNALNNLQQQRFQQLMTAKDARGNRVQPMGGVVDAFYTVRGNTDRVIYWRNLWSTVKDQFGVATGLTKGFVEVLA